MTRSFRFAPGVLPGTLLLLVFTACSGARFRDFRGEDLHATRSQLRAGAALAERHCGTCHLVPQPESMTQDTAHYMLAYMGLFLGIDASRQLDEAERQQFRQRYEYLKHEKLVPAKPAMSAGDWQALRAWYLGQARYPFESGEKATPTALDPVAFPDQGVTMLVRLQGGGYALGAGTSGALVLLSDTLGVTATIALDSPPVHLVETPAGYFVLTLGSLLGSLGENAYSTIWFVRRNTRTAQKIATGIPRAAHFVMADLNGDGKDDFLVAAFGSVTGGGIYACVMHALTCSPKLLSRHESIVRLVAIGGQKRPLQFIALAGGAREEILGLEVNDGSLRETSLVRFPPHLGSVWMQAADIDGDGMEELLVLSGDNADAGPFNEVKPDQGLRIYRFGQDKLEQLAFESLPGALSFVLLPATNTIAVARFYADPTVKQDITLLRREKGFHFARTHLALPSRPTLLATLGNDRLLVGSGNIPLATIVGGELRVRQFTGPALGSLKLPTN